MGGIIKVVGGYNKMRQGTVIAIMTNQFKTNKEPIGYRIKMTRQYGGKVVQCTVEQAQGIISRVPDAIDNLGIIDGQLKLTNGSASRYADIASSQSLSYFAPLVILCKHNIKKLNNKVVYEICDYEGNVDICDEDIALGIIKQRGIANGKVVEKAGRTMISSINGEYPIESLSEAQEQEILPYIQTTERLQDEAREEARRQAQLAETQRKLELTRQRQHEEVDARVKTNSGYKDDTINNEKDLKRKLRENEIKIANAIKTMTVNELGSSAEWKPLRDSCMQSITKGLREQVERENSKGDKSKVGKIRVGRILCFPTSDSAEPITIPSVEVEVLISMGGQNALVTMKLGVLGLESSKPDELGNGHIKIYFIRHNRGTNNIQLDNGFVAKISETNINEIITKAGSVDYSWQKDDRLYRLGAKSLEKIGNQAVITIGALAKTLKLGINLAGQIESSNTKPEDAFETVVGLRRSSKKIEKASRQRNIRL